MGIVIRTMRYDYSLTTYNAYQINTQVGGSTSLIQVPMDYTKAPGSIPGYANHCQYPCPITYMWKSLMPGCPRGCGKLGF